jgi:hypothetical protein
MIGIGAKANRLAIPNLDQGGAGVWAIVRTGASHDRYVAGVPHAHRYAPTRRRQRLEALQFPRKRRSNYQMADVFVAAQPQRRIVC